MKISTTIKTMTPLHIAMPHRVSKISIESNRPDVMGELPYTRTSVMPIPTTREAKDDDGVVSIVANTTDIPSIPANSWRGRIRRAAANIVYQALEKRGEKVSFNTFKAMQIGAIAANAIDTGSLDIALFQKAAHHPFVGLVGGGAKLIQSNYRISTSMAICEENNPNGLILNPAYRLVNPIWFKRGDDMIQFKSPMADSVINDYVPALEAWREEVLATQLKRKEERGDRNTTQSKVDLRSWSAHEVVIPNVDFSFDLDASALKNEAQIGLLIMALHDVLGHSMTEFSKGIYAPMGGWIRNGYGLLDSNNVINLLQGDDHASYVKAAVEWLSKYCRAQDFEDLLYKDTSATKEAKPKKAKAVEDQSSVAA